MESQFIQPSALLGLPTIIDGPGRYLTRNGNVATVDTVRTRISNPKLACPTFAATGSMDQKTTRGQHSARTTWHVSGRNRAIGEHGNDILRKAFPCGS